MNKIVYISVVFLSVRNSLFAQRSEMRFFDAGFSYSSVLFVVLMVVLLLIISLIYLRRKLFRLNKELQSEKRNSYFQIKKINEIDKKKVEYKQINELLTGMISHDFRNHLNVIINLSDDKTVIQAGKQIFNLVLNIIDFTNFSKSKIEIEPNTYSISRIIDAVFDELDFFFEQKKLIKKNSLDKNMFVICDANLIHRTAFNIILIAVKYANSQSSIEVTEEIVNNALRIKHIFNGNKLQENIIEMVINDSSEEALKKYGISGSTAFSIAYCKHAIDAHGQKIGLNPIDNNLQEFWFDLKLAETNNEIFNDIQFSKAEKNLLIPFVKQLNEFELFQFSELMNIINTIPDESENIRNWKYLINKGVSQCNKKIYSECMKDLQDIE